MSIGAVRTSTTDHRHANVNYRTSAYTSHSSSVQELKRDEFSSTKSCSSMQGILGTLRVLLEADSSVSSATLCNPGTTSFTSDWKDLGWGCGYRNIQMLLSSLLTSNPNQYRDAFATLDIHSISEIQAGIENAWKRGFDTEGAAQLHWKLSGTKKWIGATEVYAFLTAAGYDSLLVQFEGRDHVSRLMDYCESYFSPKGLQSNHMNHQTKLNPLYLQHQGHSRTIIGFTRTDVGLSLLILDPAKRVSKSMKRLEEEWSRPGTKDEFKAAKAHDLLKPYVVRPKTLRKQQYQLLQVMEGISQDQRSDRKVIKPIIV